MLGRRSRYGCCGSGCNTFLLLATIFENLCFFHWKYPEVPPNCSKLDWFFKLFSGLSPWTPPTGLTAPPEPQLRRLATLVVRYAHFHRCAGPTIKNFPRPWHVCLFSTHICYWNLEGTKAWPKKLVHFAKKCQKNLRNLGNLAHFFSSNLPVGLQLIY